MIPRYEEGFNRVSVKAVYPAAKMATWKNSIDSTDFLSIIIFPFASEIFSNKTIFIQLEAR
jgi:hypothetical protein